MFVVIKCNVVFKPLNSIYNISKFYSFFIFSISLLERIFNLLKMNNDMSNISSNMNSSIQSQSKQIIKSLSLRKKYKYSIYLIETSQILPQKLLNFLPNILI